MKELEVTWNRVLKIWWSYMWRFFLLVILVSLLFGFLAGFMAAFLGLKNIPPWIHSLFGFLLGFFASLFIFKYILKKNFGEFEIKLVSCEVTPDEVKQHLKNLSEQENRKF